MTVNLYLKDVFLPPTIIMEDAWWVNLVLKELTSEVELVSLMFPAKMVRNGTMIESIVFALKGPNGTGNDAYLVVEEKHGLLLKDVYVQQDHSFRVQGVKKLLKIDVLWSLILYGMALNVFAMMDLLL